MNSLKMMTQTFALLGLFLGGGALLVGCEGGASCTEDCEKDEDCGADLSCFATGSGMICLPSECDTCFDDGRRCYYDTSDEDDGESLMCEYTGCD